jgi:hypothetical protein
MIPSDKHDRDDAPIIFRIANIEDAWIAPIFLRSKAVDCEFRGRQENYIYRATVEIFCESVFDSWNGPNPFFSVV